LLATNDLGDPGHASPAVATVACICLASVNLWCTGTTEAKYGRHRRYSIQFIPHIPLSWAKGSFKPGAMSRATVHCLIILPAALSLPCSTIPRRPRTFGAAGVPRCIFALDHFERGPDFGLWIKEIARNRVRQEMRSLVREERRLAVHRKHLVSICAATVSGVPTPRGDT